MAIIAYDSTLQTPDPRVLLADGKKLIKVFIF